MEEELPRPLGRDHDGRFLQREDPLVALGVRISSSARDRLRAVVTLPGHPWSGKEPTVVARELLCQAIDEMWTQASQADPERAAAAQRAAQRFAEKSAERAAQRKAELKAAATVAAARAPEVVAAVARRLRA